MQWQGKHDSRTTALAILNVNAALVMGDALAIALLEARDGVRLVGSTAADPAVRAPTVAFSSAKHSSAAIYDALRLMKDI